MNLKHCVDKASVCPGISISHVAYSQFMSGKMSTEVELDAVTHVDDTRLSVIGHLAVLIRYQIQTFSAVQPENFARQ